MGCEKYKKQSGNIVTLPTYSSSYFLSNHVSLCPTSDKRNVLSSWFLAITLYSIIIELSIKNLYIFCKKRNWILKWTLITLWAFNAVSIEFLDDASCWVEWIHMIEFFLYIDSFLNKKLYQRKLHYKKFQNTHFNFKGRPFFVEYLHTSYLSIKGHKYQ